jgi:Rrf2 family protein
MLSQRSHYALRAMLVLAAADGATPMRTGQIAKAANLSPKFLEGILLELRKAGILRSYRGCKGGFVLARPAHEISFADIVRVTDGSLALSSCTSEVAYARCEGCFDETICEIRRALLTAREVTAHVLQSYDLASAGSRMRGAGPF